jgi:hypothetical protein
MKRFNLISGILVAATLLLIGASLMQQFSPATHAEARPDSTAPEYAGPVRVLCRELEGQAVMRLCLRSNGTGNLVVYDGVQRAEYQYTFFDAGAACPDAPANTHIHMRSAATADLLEFGFSEAEVHGDLGLPEHFCAFAAAG